MKRLILIGLFILLSFPVNAKEWTNNEIILEVTWQAMNYIDYRQAKVIFEDDRFEEKNPLVTKPEVVLWFALIHFVISNVLEENRVLWQGISIGTKFGVISYNYYIGVKF